jgi:hypothetical protein
MTAEIRHRTIAANGITMHVAEAGAGPLVLMCHGWPELWYSWRHQLVALANAGFNAVAPDMLGEKELTITTDSEMHMSAVRDILETKALRRNLSLKIFNFGSVEEISGGKVRQVATLQQGIPEEVAKKLQKLIREQFPKVQPRIQGEALRIGSKSRDELQGVIRLVKEHQDDFTVPLQFNNYR